MDGGAVSVKGKGWAGGLKAECDEESVSGGGTRGGGGGSAESVFFPFSGCPNLPSSGSSDSDHEQEAGAGTPLKCRAERCVNWRHRHTGVVG